MLQLQRLMKRDQMGEDAAVQRIRSQMSLNDKVSKADVVIDNSSDLSQLQVQVKNLIQRIRPSTLTWMFEYIGPPAIIAGFAVVAKLYLPRALLYLGDVIAKKRAGLAWWIKTVVHFSAEFRSTLHLFLFSTHTLRSIWYMSKRKRHRDWHPCSHPTLVL